MEGEHVGRSPCLRKCGISACSWPVWCRAVLAPGNGNGWPVLSMAGDCRQGSSGKRKEANSCLDVKGSTGGDLFGPGPNCLCSISNGCGHRNLGNHCYRAVLSVSADLFLESGSYVNGHSGLYSLLSSYASQTESGTIRGCCNEVCRCDANPNSAPNLEAEMLVASTHFCIGDSLCSAWAGNCCLRSFCRRNCFGDGGKLASVGQCSRQHRKSQPRSGNS
mmetsp:Transcript_65175/g.155593  ORF Transcript_65175/g.155593 Transcript_65175/m.155593 type:complete len:220 (+) Transcript_65175:695-1354(+)